MASQSLYRKWRSQTFNEMVGQEPIIRTLRNALVGNNLGHAYLFTGPRGTGKTTTARLLAKTVNCTNSQNGEPCNECAQCREITAGNSFNVIEIDAASNRGIDSIRELREKVMVPPSTGKYKIYILDEAHMLTTEAFNALLKTLEEPPDYAIFVMATTDVHKMLPTVLSRCQRFDFKRISTHQIVEHLLFVAKEESVEVDPDAAGLIARTAAGGMRDALSLLDQAMAYSGGSISLAQVQSMLGVADPRAISKLITHMANLDSPALLYLIHELSEAGADLRQINSQLIEYWRALMLARAGADVAAILDLTEDEVTEVQLLIPSFTLEELTECARIFAQNDLMHKNQGTPQLGLELASLECVELHRRVQSGGVVRQNTAAPASTQATQQPPALVTTARAAVAALTQQSAPSAPSRRDEAVINQARPVEESRRNDAPAGRSQEAERAHPVQESGRDPSSGQQQGRLTLQQVAASWESVKKRTMQKSPRLAAYIGMCDVVGVEDDGEHTTITIRAAKPLHFKSIKEDDHPKDVEWALSMEFNIPCKLRLLGPDQLFTGEDQNVTSYSRSAGTSQPSAYRERTPQLPAQPEAVPQPSAYRERAQPEVAFRPQQSNSSAHRESARSDVAEIYRTQPPAIQHEVRENKKIVLPKEELERKARQDPVVQEIVRMFGATPGDVQPK